MHLGRVITSPRCTVGRVNPSSSAFYQSKGRVDGSLDEPMVCGVCVVCVCVCVCVVCVCGVCGVCGVCVWCVCGVCVRACVRVRHRW